MLRTEHFPAVCRMPQGLPVPIPFVLHAEDRTLPRSLQDATRTSGVNSDLLCVPTRCTVFRMTLSGQLDPSPGTVFPETAATVQIVWM